MVRICAMLVNAGTARKTEVALQAFYRCVANLWETLSWCSAHCGGTKEVKS